MDGTFDRNLAHIEGDLSDLLGSSVDNLEEEFDDDDDGQQKDDEHRDEFRPDWMILSEMGPNVIIDTSSDLGLRDIDRNNNWFDDIMRLYPDIDSIDIPNFIQNFWSENLVSSENLIVDFQTLNEKQMIIFKRFESHYNDILTKQNNKVEPLRFIIMGTAGTGKSYLINTIRVRIQEMAMNNGIETSPVIVLAPTGVTAFNILGTTIHSTLSVPISNSNFNIEGE